MKNHTLPKYHKAIVLSSFILSAALSSAVYASDINVTIDNTPVAFDTAQPTIIEGRTLVPLRGVFEKLGFKVNWDNATKTATLIKDTTIVKAKTDQLLVNDEPVNGVNPAIINDSFMVPVRAVSEAAGCSVNWDQSSRTVIINTDIPQPDIKKLKEKKEENKGDISLSADQYIENSYAKINEIREYVKQQDNKPLMRYLGLGYTWDKSIAPTPMDHGKLESMIQELRNMPIPQELSGCTPYITSYCDLFQKAIDANKSAVLGDITQTEMLDSIDALKDEKDNMAMLFSVVLNDYFTEKGTFYEGAYDEYLLDMLK